MLIPRCCVFMMTQNKQEVLSADIFFSHFMILLDFECNTSSVPERSHTHLRFVYFDYKH